MLLAPALPAGPSKVSTFHHPSHCFASGVVYLSSLKRSSAAYEVRVPALVAQSGPQTGDRSDRDAQRLATGLLLAAAMTGGRALERSAGALERAAGHDGEHGGA